MVLEQISAYNFFSDICNGRNNARYSEDPARCISLFPSNSARAFNNNSFSSGIYDFNGQVDAGFKQGDTIYDCWLLSAIYSISRTSVGNKILNNSVNILPDGRISVTLKGVDRQYIFSKQYIKSRSELSNGDLDVRAIEIAMEAYLNENPMRGKYGLDSNRPWVAFKLLTGKGAHYSDAESNVNGQFSDYRIRNFNKNNHVAVVWSTNNRPLFYQDKNCNAVKLESCHTYSVLSSDDNYVYVVNPHDTDEKLSVPIDIFKTFFNCANEFDL